MFLNLRGIPTPCSWDWWLGGRQSAAAHSTSTVPRADRSRGPVL